MSKLQQRTKSESHNVFTEEIIKNNSNANEDKGMKSIDLI